MIALMVVDAHLSQMRRDSVGVLDGRHSIHLCTRNWQASVIAKDYFLALLNALIAFARIFQHF